MNPRRTFVAAALAWGVTPLVWSHGGGLRNTGAGAARPSEQKPWGISGEASAVKRTIEVRMFDKLRFEPRQIRVQQGETVRFVVRNRGRVQHEMVIGTLSEMDQHAQLMKKFPGMEHDEPYMAHVAPGKQRDLIWNFNRPGEFQFACLVAGHYEAGMVGTITVVPAKP